MSDFFFNKVFFERMLFLSLGIGGRYISKTYKPSENSQVKIQSEIPFFTMNSNDV